MSRISRKWHLLALVTTAACHSGLVRAAIFDQDDRQYVSAEPGSPFAPVGLVTRGGLIEHRTTGTLVDECHVLTSQHLFGLRTSAVGKRVRFIGSPNTPDQVSSSGTVVVEGGLENYSWTTQVVEARAHDWLLVKLDKCLGTALGYARLVRFLKSSEPHPQMISAGYPVDRSTRSGLTVDPSCQISAYPLIWYTDCATMQGDSGGPVFRLIELNGRKVLDIYAINSAGYPWKNAVPFVAVFANQATPVEQIVPQIERYLSAGSLNTRSREVRIEPAQNDRSPDVSSSN